MTRPGESRCGTTAFCLVLLFLQPWCLVNHFAVLHFPMCRFSFLGR